MYDLQEQEQLDELKAWWKKNGRVVILTIITFVIAAAGAQAWRYYQQSQAQQAAELYGTLQQLVPENNPKKIRETSAIIIEKFLPLPTRRAPR